MDDNIAIKLVNVGMCGGHGSVSMSHIPGERTLSLDKATINSSRNFASLSF